MTNQAFCGQQCRVFCLVAGVWFLALSGRLSQLLDINQQTSVDFEAKSVSAFAKHMKHAPKTFLEKEKLKASKVQKAVFTTQTSTEVQEKTPISSAYVARAPLEPSELVKHMIKAKLYGMNNSMSRPRPNIVPVGLIPELKFQPTESYLKKIVLNLLDTVKPQSETTFNPPETAVTTTIKTTLASTKTIPDTTTETTKKPKTTVNQHFTIETESPQVFSKKSARSQQCKNILQTGHWENTAHWGWERLATANKWNGMAEGETKIVQDPTKVDYGRYQTNGTKILQGFNGTWTPNDDCNLHEFDNAEIQQCFKNKGRFVIHGDSRGRQMANIFRFPFRSWETPSGGNKSMHWVSKYSAFRSFCPAPKFGHF